MDAVYELYRWTTWILFYGLIALRLWALIDCLLRRSDAFPAADKLTKPAWIAILLISGLLGTFASISPVYPISLISTVVAAVYLADVRPAVREISDKR